MLRDVPGLALVCETRYFGPPDDLDPFSTLALKRHRVGGGVSRLWDRPDAAVLAQSWVFADGDMAAAFLAAYRAHLEGTMHVLGGTRTVVGGLEAAACYERVFSVSSPSNGPMADAAGAVVARGRHALMACAAATDPSATAELAWTSARALLDDGLPGTPNAPGDTSSGVLIDEAPEGFTLVKETRTSGVPASTAPALAAILERHGIASGASRTWDKPGAAIVATVCDLADADAASAAIGEYRAYADPIVEASAGALIDVPVDGALGYSGVYFARSPANPGWLTGGTGVMFARGARLFFLKAFGPDGPALAARIALAQDART